MDINSPEKLTDNLCKVVLDTVSDGVTVIDNDLKIKFHNKIIKAEALLKKALLKHNEVLKQLNSELSDATGYVKTVLPPPTTSGPLHIG